MGLSKESKAILEQMKKDNLEKRIKILRSSIHDAEWRIGSHIAGGNEIDTYVENQKKLIRVWSEELANLLEVNK